MLTNEQFAKRVMWLSLGGAWLLTFSGCKTRDLSSQAASADNCSSPTSYGGVGDIMDRGAKTPAYQTMKNESVAETKSQIAETQKNLDAKKKQLKKTPNDESLQSDISSLTKALEELNDTLAVQSAPTQPSTAKQVLITLSCEDSDRLRDDQKKWQDVSEFMKEDVTINCSNRRCWIMLQAPTVQKVTPAFMTSNRGIGPGEVKFTYTFEKPTGDTGSVGFNMQSTQSAGYYFAWAGKKPMIPDYTGPSVPKTGAGIGQFNIVNVNSIGQPWKMSGDSVKEEREQRYGGTTVYLSVGDSARIRDVMAEGEKGGFAVGTKAPVSLMCAESWIPAEQKGKCELFVEQSLASKTQTGSGMTFELDPEMSKHFNESLGGRPTLNFETEATPIIAINCINGDKYVEYGVQEPSAADIVYGRTPAEKPQPKCLITVNAGK